MEKQFVVLGLGIFGSTLVKTLSQYGREVIAIDKNPENVQRVADFATKAVIGDVTDFQFLSDLGLDDMDVGIVAIGDRLEDSILATMNLKELGVPYVIVKAKNKRFKVVLEKIGADYVVRPEMGEKVARTLLRKNIKDLIELDEENCIVEMKVPQAWVGKTLSQLDLRKLYSINVLGKRNPHTHKLEVPVDPNLEIELNDTFLVLAQTDEIEKYEYLLWRFTMKNEETLFLFAKAIKSLIKKQPLDKITVTDIVSTAGKTRQTFYRHFQDKYDLVNWDFEKLVLKSFEEMNQGGSLQEALNLKFAFIEQEHTFFKEAFKSNDYNNLIHYDFCCIYDFYKNYIYKNTGKTLFFIKYVLSRFCRYDSRMGLK